MTGPALPAVGVSALFASNGAGAKHGPTWAAIEVELGGSYARGVLLRRVAPPGDWAGMSRHGVTVLGLLLDGQRWERATLAKAARINDRAARAAVEELRHLGFPVVSRSVAGGGGYRLSDDAGEVLEWLAREVTPRAMRQHEIEGRMRAAAMRLRASASEGAQQPSQLRLWEVA